ncbi:hypothetical protein MTR67_015659 [Solanum verrucosum]|uniref:Uncharacterized protein n=1 Tax=Solanum verrucosum TaxID=315347 RepID=A0AAF0QEE8_SOLVR|nr:hypothetical protein MTR67_015659 [Solanum verrucosum]
MDNIKILHVRVLQSKRIVAFKKMPIYKIRGIDVDFPYEAYDCQIAYMEKVIQSLQNVLYLSSTFIGF